MGAQLFAFFLGLCFGAKTEAQIPRGCDAPKRSQSWNLSEKNKDRKFPLGFGTSSYFSTRHVRMVSSMFCLSVHSQAPTWSWNLFCFDHTTTNVTKVLWFLLGKSPKQAFPVKSFWSSLSLEEQPQNFRDINGRLNQHPRLKLWFIICLLEFAAAGIMLMLSAENVLSSVIVHVGFWENHQSNHSLWSFLAVVYL